MKKSNIEDSIKHFPFFVVISIIFFVRGNVFGNSSVLPSITMLIPVFILLTYIINSFDRINQNYPIIPFNYVFFFVAIFINQVINSIIFIDQYKYSFRFGLEIFLNFLVFYLPFFLIVKKKILYSKIDTFIKVASFFGFIPIFIIAAQMSNIRRIGTGDADLPIAVNHIGHTLALVSILSLYGLLKYYLDSEKSKKNFIFNLIVFFASTLATFLTGSKAAIIGMSSYSFFLILFKLKVKKLFISFIVIFVTFLLVIGKIISSGRIDRLMRRFDWDSLILGFTQRVRSFSNAVDSIQYYELILGSGWRYQEINPTNFIHYPHNIIISILFHAGIIAMALFITILIRQIYIIVKIYRYGDWLLGLTLLGLFCTVLIFSLTSGRLTKIMTIFFIMGMNEGIFKIKNEENNLYKYC